MGQRKKKRVERGQINHINIDPEITADGNDLIGKEPIDSIDTLACFKIYNYEVDDWLFLLLIRIVTKLKTV